MYPSQMHMLKQLFTTLICLQHNAVKEFNQELINHPDTREFVIYFDCM